MSGAGIIEEIQDHMHILTYRSASVLQEDIQNWSQGSDSMYWITHTDLCGYLGAVQGQSATPIIGGNSGVIRKFRVKQMDPFDASRRVASKNGIGS